VPVSKGKGKQQSKTTTEYEVLNPKGIAMSPPSSPAPASDEDEDDEPSVPEMTPSIEGFSKLPRGGFSESWEYIKEHRDVVVPGASDALLVAAFRAERAGNRDYAKRCTHQSLLLQYGEKIGRDGVTVFFRK
jgi:cell division cycle protein 37